MVMHHQEHDNNYNYQEDPNNPGEPDPNAPRSKTIFGVTLQPLPSNLTNAAAMKEVNEALDVIANHPNVGPFISRLLIQRLVKSNPSRAYMRRVTRVFRDNGSGQRGDMQAVIKAILLDEKGFWEPLVDALKVCAPSPSPMSRREPHLTVLPSPGPKLCWRTATP